MFKKILIANRGEIACRIIKTARRMGIKTVAVYSEVDRDALHVQMADESFLIGPAPAAQSYLVIENIIEACRATGAEAVHPGYGFLSEREAFPKALEKAGIIFIGPNPAAIAAMGDKIESKKAAAKAGVSTVPGHLGEIADIKQAQKIAQEIGYPVMIKASAGGGGKGMRIAYNTQEVEEGFALAKSEAKSSFGDDRVFIEKFIEDPRHIEIQVLGDKHGNIIYLGERECSIQRRNQKVIEEAPSPLLDEATRKKMGEQAVALAKAVNYDSAGTVEFVAGQDKSFYFLEMNTRLQVEHPVTEFITGLDLVEQMIRIAAGEKLPFKQKDVQLNGWAVESRIYAEDPYRDFLPSIGRLTTYRPPRAEAIEGAVLRIDDGVEEGSAISLFYDPMIGKLVTHASSRAAAIKAQALALDSFAIAGIAHNIPFLSALMNHPRFMAGKLSTAFIKNEFPEGFEPRPFDKNELHRFAAVAGAIDNLSNERRKRISGQLGGRSYVFPPRRIALLNEAQVFFEVTALGRETSIRILDKKAKEIDKFVLVSNWKPGERVWQGTINGEKIAVGLQAFANGFWLSRAGYHVKSHVFTEREAELYRLMPPEDAKSNRTSIICPMPGLVKAIYVKMGQGVKAGEVVAVVEAMKMENQLRSERDGVIKSIGVKVGDILSVDAVMMEFA
jgi:propionyl-CoA carboxylase alpha chain